MNDIGSALDMFTLNLLETLHNNNKNEHELLSNIYFTFSSIQLLNLAIIIYEKCTQNMNVVSQDLFKL